ncbi:hypothetical protein ACWEP8_34105 [Streptomyces hydrogenans]
MRSRAAVADRAALALAGTALLAGAAGATRWGGDRILRTGLRYLEQAGHGPVALAGLLGTALWCCLLATRLPRPAPRRLRLPAPGCSLDSRAVRRAVRARCSAVPGVVRARCRLTRRGRRLDLSLTLTLDRGTNPAAVLTDVSTTVLPPFTTLLTPGRLSTRIHLTVPRHRRRRPE